MVPNLASLLPRPFTATVLFTLALMSGHTAHATLVGNMEGSFAVSSGAAHYSLPIQVTPGVAAMSLS